MDNSNQISQTSGTAPKKHIQALSLIITTEPTLFNGLAPNPFSQSALQLSLERFSYADSIDVIKAVIFAEPEGKYDSTFKTLEKIQQEEELHKQEDLTALITIRLSIHCKKYRNEFRQLTKEFLYDHLSRVVFETEDIKKIEKEYSQSQRRDYKLLIINSIENISTIKAFNKRKHRKRSLFLGGIVAFLFILFLFLAGIVYFKQIRQEQPQDIKPPLGTDIKMVKTKTQKERQGLPMRLTIPSININASIQNEGVTPQGAMGVPNNIVDVGWFDLGPRPGEVGSAVIAGHFDGENGEAGVFANLSKLKAGDKLYIQDSNGKTTIFVVQKSSTYNPGYAENVFSSNNGAHLNLITCDGIWDITKKSYTKRLVVFADIIK